MESTDPQNEPEREWNDTFASAILFLSSTFWSTSSAFSASSDVDNNEIGLAQSILGSTTADIVDSFK